MGTCSVNSVVEGISVRPANTGHLTERKLLSEDVVAMNYVPIAM